MGNIVQADVVSYAINLGNITDSATIARLPVIAAVIIDKVSNYLNYTAPDTLTSIVAEMVVTQINRYNDLQGASIINGDMPTAKVQRGDYTVEYDVKTFANLQATSLLMSYEWCLKSYKKLRTL